MEIRKAVITAAGPGQRSLPVQRLIDRDGVEKPLLKIVLEQALTAGIEEIAVIIPPGAEDAFTQAVEEHAGRLRLFPQEKPLGYGHAIYCAREFVGNELFLHLLGDHLYVSGDDKSCARQLVAVAQAESCSVSAVQPTRENLLSYFGTVGGRRVAGRKDLYLVEAVIEKPTPTEAELRLLVPGLRAGHYLCFFGMHVLTPTVMEILADQVSGAGDRGGVTLSAALAALAGREKYLALEEKAWRYDVGVRYGLTTAQLALALSGSDRAEVLGLLLELMAQNELGVPRR